MSEIQKALHASFYSTVGTNGIYHNLISADYTNKRVEHLHWKTSYPLVDFLYPQWLTGNVKNKDFWWESVKYVQDQFKWQITSVGKTFFTPVEQFGVGVSDVHVMIESDEFVPEIPKTQENIIFAKTKELDLKRAFTKYLEHFSSKVVYIVLNFLSVDIYEFTPKGKAPTLRWDMKKTSVRFDDPKNLLDRIASRKFMSFVGINQPEEQIFNTFMNYIYWKPAMTSSDLVKDIFRAIYTELLSELVQYTNIAKVSEGMVVLSGEVPAFFGEKQPLELMTVDGLGLGGTWGIYIDTYHLLGPQLMKTLDMGVLPLQMIIPSTDVWIIPHRLADKDVVKATINLKEYLATSGSLFRYKIENYGPQIESEIHGIDHSMKVPEAMKLKSIVIDARSWPIVYGPHPANNHGRISEWLHRLHTYTEI